MPTFASNVLGELDFAYALGGALGLHPITVTVRKRVWTGPRPGLGTKTDTLTQLINRPQTSATWAAGTQYLAYQSILASPDNGILFVAATGGTSGGTQPVWNTTLGQQTVDGNTGLVWRAQALSSYPVRCRQVSRKEAIASGGLYTNQDFRVGPIVPPYTVARGSGGFDDGTLDPAPTASTATEVHYILASSNGTFGLPATGLLFNKIGEDVSALHYFAIVRSMGVAP